jgi:parallel beta helix pectate lyase-like protein
MKSSIRITIAVCTIVLCLAVNTARATDFHVTNSSQFQAALATAGSNGGNDTILLAAGTYYGNFKFTAGEAYGLTIKPDTGAPEGSVILDGQQAGYVLLMDASGLEVAFIVEGLTIQNGNSMEHGGGIYAKQPDQPQIVGSFTVTNCIVKDNQAQDYGGGAYFGQFQLVTIEESTISNSSGNVGGVYCQGAVTFTNNTISNNFGRGVSCDGPGTFTNNTISNNSGGGVDCHGEGTFMNNTVSNNFGVGVWCSSGDFTKNIITGNTSAGGATEEGGGVHCLSGTFTNNIISHNSVGFGYSVGGDGGGVYCYGGGTFTNNIIIYNSASDGSGGGVYCNGGGVFTNNTISNNSTSRYGGGVRCSAGGKFTNNTISNNNSALSGGGVYCYQGAGTFTNNTIVYNIGHGIYCDPETNDIANIYNNIIWGNQVDGVGKDVYMAGYGQESNFYNNIYTSAFALWDNEGGNQIIDPLFHDPDNDDFHVTETSPAINAGLNTAPEIPATDLDGNPRILESIVDIGAYERSTAALHPADLNEDWTIQQTEFDSYNTAWRANTAWQNPPNTIPMNFVTRAGYLLQKGGGYTNIGVGKPGTWIPSQ